VIRVTTSQVLGARKKIKLITKVTVTPRRCQIQPDLDGGESAGYRDRLFQQFLDSAASTVIGWCISFLVTGVLGSVEM
jgi:hypothetical protein